MVKSIFFLFIFIASFSAISSYSKDCPMTCFIGYCCGDRLKHTCCQTTTICDRRNARCIGKSKYLFSSQVTPSYVDVIMMVDGFFNSAKVYQNLPECTKAFTKLVSMAPEIINLINEIKQADSAEKIIPVAIEGLVKLYPKIQELIQESSEVPNELKKTFKEVLEILQTK